jgi:hypothetical protein
MPDSLRTWTPTTYARSGSRSGGVSLPGLGAVLVLLILGGVGGAVDVFWHGNTSRLFDVVFVVACVIAALLVRHGSLAVAVVAPPLVYVLLVVAIDQFVALPAGGGWLIRQLVAAGDALVTGAPAIWLGTALAAIIVGLRKLRTRP